MKTVLTILAIFLLSVSAVQANKKLPLATGIVINKAQTLYQAGDLQSAIQTLEAFNAKTQGLDQKTILKKGYDHYYVHFLLGNYYLARSHATEPPNVPLKKETDPFLKTASKHFKKSADQEPSFSAAWLNLGACLYEMHSYKQAAQAFEQGYKVSKIPKAIHLYYAAVCYFQADKPKQALPVFEKLLAVHPDKVTLVWKEVLVNILFSLEQYKKAIPFLEELAHQPGTKKRKQWQEVLLHQYLSLQMNKKALVYANHLTRTDPLEPKWWKALCHIHLSKNQIRQGLTSLIVYGYITPLSREELNLAADLCLSLDIPFKAAQFYKQALSGLENQTDETAKSQGRQWLMLGYAAMHSGQYDRAKQAFKKAVKYDKQKKQAKTAIARIESIEKFEAPL